MTHEYIFTVNLNSQIHLLVLLICDQVLTNILNICHRQNDSSPRLYRVQHLTDHQTMPADCAPCFIAPVSLAPSSFLSTLQRPQLSRGRPASLARLRTSHVRTPPNERKLVVVPPCSRTNPADWKDSSSDWRETGTPQQPSAVQPLPSLTRIAHSLWKFSRPHTVYGTFLSIVSLTIVAIIASRIPLHSAVIPFLTAIIPALLLNVYIVGLNQIYDIPIDKINKPNLPLASGAMTLIDAWRVILSSLISGLAFCFAPMSTAPLRVVLIGSVLLGTMYSAPPVRLKRFALLASIAIFTVRGLLINLGFFLHTKIASGITVNKFSLAAYPPVVIFATAFFTVFGVVIALLKDVPDIKGDRLFGIRTFSVRVGASSIFRACVFMLASMFVIAGSFYAIVANSVPAKILSLLLHFSTAIYLTRRARAVDPESSKSVTDFYMLSWKAFYLEYLFLPLASL